MQHGFIKVAAATPRVQVADPVHNAAEIAQLPAGPNRRVCALWYARS